MYTKEQRQSIVAKAKKMGWGAHVLAKFCEDTLGVGPNDMTETQAAVLIKTMDRFEAKQGGPLSKVTERQINAIMALGRVLGWNSEQIRTKALDTYGVPPDMLTKADASALIGELQNSAVTSEAKPKPEENVAEVTQSSEVVRKGKPAEKDPDRVSLEPVEVYLGDGNAEVGFTRTLRLAGGDYNAVVIGASVHVGLRCNQDDITVRAALSKARQIADAAVGKDMETMQRRLDSLVASLPSKR